MDRAELWGRGEGTASAVRTRGRRGGLNRNLQVTTLFDKESEEMDKALSRRRTGEAITTHKTPSRAKPPLPPRPQP